MNALPAAFGGWQSIVDAPVWGVLLLKVTAILLAAWAGHLALARTNPRWRVALWRVTAVGLITLPAMAWLLPALKLHVLPADEPAVVAAESHSLPLPASGRGAGGEGGAALGDGKTLDSETFRPFSASNLDPRFAQGGAMTEGRTGNAQPSESSLVRPAEDIQPTNVLTLTVSEHRPEVGRERGPILLAVWLGGIAILGFRLCLGHYRISAIVRRARPTTPEVQSECVRVAEAIGCRRRVEVVQSAEVDSPFLSGLCRPLLLLPGRMCDKKYRKDLPGILAHELAHVRSHDVRWNLGLQLISIGLWFHPLIWRMRRTHLAACELVSDAASASFVGDVTDYCRMLARVAVDVCGSVPAAGIAMARTSAIGRRLSVLKRHVFHMPLRRRSVLGFGFAAMLAVAVVGTLQLALAEPPAEEKTAAAEVTQGASSAAEAQGAKTAGRSDAEKGEAGASADKTASVVEDNKKPKEHDVGQPSVDGREPTASKPVVLKSKGRKEFVRVIEGTLVDENGRPEPGVAIRGLSHTENAPVVRSDAQGRFEVRVESRRCRLTVIAETSDKARQAYHQFLWDADEKESSPVRLTMRKARSIEVSVVDGAGKPVADAVVGAVVSYEEMDGGRSDPRGSCVFRFPADVNLQNIFAFKSKLGLDYVAFPPKGLAWDDASAKPDGGKSLTLTLGGAKTARIKLVDPEGKPVAGMVLRPWFFEKQDRSQREWWNDLNMSGMSTFDGKTDAEGVAVFDWLPTWNSDHVTFRLKERAKERGVGYCAPDRILFDPKAGREEMAVTLVRTVPLRGRVRFADGRPAEGIEVSAAGAGYHHPIDEFHEVVPTDAEGRFELQAYPDQVCMIVAGDTEWAAEARTGVVVRRDTPVEGVDLQLQPATEIRGRVTVGPEKQPIAKQWMTLIQMGPDELAPESTRSPRTSVRRSTTADEQGRYTFHVGPGSYRLLGPENLPDQTFSVGREKTLTFDFHSPRPARGVLTGHVLRDGKEGEPVGEVEITGLSKDSTTRKFRTTTDGQGHFRVERDMDAMWLHARTRGRSLAGAVEIGEEQADVVIAMKPSASVKGRLIDLTSKTPLSDRKIGAEVSVRLPNAGGRGTCFAEGKTDAEGRFVLGGLVVGVEYRFLVFPASDKEGRKAIRPEYFGGVVPQGSSVQDVGNLEVRFVDPPAAKLRSVRLHVVDEAGKPIPNAELRAESANPQRLMRAKSIVIKEPVRLKATAAKMGFARGAIISMGTEVIGRPEEAGAKAAKNETRWQIRVVDEAGKPVPRAKIEATIKPASGEKPITLTADSVTLDTQEGVRGDGRHEPFEAAAISITLDADGCVKVEGARSLEVPPAKEDKPAGAAKPALLRVRVLDPEGKPLEGANVHASIWSEEKGFKANQDYKTDATGIAQVQLPKSYTIVRLWAGRKPYVTMFSHWEKYELAGGMKLPKEYTIQLESAVSAGGRVVDEQGKPIAGAKVEVRAKGGKPAKGDRRTEYNACLVMEKADSSVGEDAVAVTNAEGRWRIDSVPSDAKTELYVRVSHPDYPLENSWGWFQDAVGVTTAMLRQQTAVLTLKRGVVVRGRVTDPTGKPVKDAMVVRLTNMAINYRSCVLVDIAPDRASTDAEGQFQLRSAELGDAKVAVVAPGWAPQLRHVDLRSGMPPEEVRLTPGKTIELRFVDASQKPVPDVEVHVGRVQGEPWFTDHEHRDSFDTKIPAKADKNGIWRWTWAPDGPVEIGCWQTGFADSKVAIAGGDPPRTVTLKPEHYIDGRVTDAVTGKPIPRFAIIPVDVFRNEWSYAERLNAKPGNDGRFKYLAERTDIALRLRIEAAGYRTQTGPEFRVGDDSPRTQDFALHPSKPITGIVLDAAGKPVEKTEVSLATPTEEVHSSQENDAVPTNHKTTTDSAGRFEFPDPGEPFAVVAEADAGYAMAEFAADEHDAGKLRLKAWASVRGQFRDGGKPVQGAWIHLDPVRVLNLQRPVVRGMMSVRTDADGRFEFSRVPPMPVSVRASLGPWRDEGYRSGPSVPVDLEPGQKVELDLGGAGATIKGKVKLTGDVPAGLDCAYSVSYLVSRAPDIVALPAIADLGFDIRKGWQATWPNSLEGQAYLRTLRHWFVKLAPDGTFRISGVPPGDYDLAIEVYAKPSGCLVEPLARKVVLVTVTQGDVGRRELTLPEIAAKVTPIPVVGDTPSLSYERPDGAAGSLAGVRGHYTVVQFWANWCGLCKQQLPLLKQLQARFASQGLGVIGISVDTDAAAWQAAVKQLALPWPQGRLASAGDSGVPTVPGYWLLDPAGKIIAKGSAPKELMAALEKVEGNRTTSAKDAEPAGDAERHEPAVSRDGKNPQEEVVRGDVSSKGKAAYVMIRLPDGKPAVGAEARLCREKKDDLVERLSVSNGRITHRDASERRANVGADGRFRMEPQDNPFVLVVVHDAGIGEATSEELAAKPEVTLQAWGKVVGSVQRGAQPWPDLQIHADAVGAHNLLRFRETTKTDAKGNFAFPKLRPGKWRVEAMSVGTKAGKTSPADQTVDVAPGQSVSVAFHGVGRPAVGRIQWAGGKPPKGNLSRIMVAVHSVLSKPTPPPQEVCDQGPDAVRAWLKQWRESEEGKAWWSHNEQFYRPADASIDGKGALSVGAIEAGRYTLKAHMTSTEPRLPWERPKMLCYEGSFTMPEIAGGVSDEPLDLGSVQMVDKTPPAPRLDSVQPPASMPAGAKRVGGLRDHVELLRYVAAQNQQNKGKIRTWKGMATVEDRESADEEGVGYDSSTTVGFVFDQARKSVRWNETLDKWMRIERGQRIPQATPQIFNGMVTPGGLYRFAQSDDVLDDSDKRPMVLTICEPDDGSWGRLVKDSYGRQQPPFRDFNPMAGFDVGMFPFGDFSVLSSIDFLMLRGGLGQDLSVYLALADSPGLAGIKVILSGDTIMIDIGDADVCVRYTLSLSQGCNPIACDSILPVGHSEWRWTYESVDGIWVPKTFSETSHRKGKCDEQRKVTFVENRVNLSVEPGAFDLYRLGIQVGDKVVDQRTGQEYIYLGEDSVPNPAKAIRNR